MTEQPPYMFGTCPREYDTRPTPPAEHAMIYDAEHPNGITFPEYANAIRKDEREKVLEKIIKLPFHCYPHPASDIGNGQSRFVLLKDIEESLRRGVQE